MTATDFSRRSTQTELMDTEPVGFEEFDQCLRQLAIINICTLAYRPTLNWLRRMLRHATPHEHIAILDVGSGGGDMLRKIAQWMRRREVNADLTGVDLNPWSGQSAEQATPASMRIRFETSNIFSFDQARRFDFIISCNFTHHLSDAELVRFIQWMDTHATRGWLINDLHRHPLPYYFVKYVFRVLPFSRLTRNDGPISVSRAFIARDWRRLLADAGIPTVRTRVRWFFPFRYAVSCSKT